MHTWCPIAPTLQLPGEENSEMKRLTLNRRQFLRRTALGLSATAALQFSGCSTTKRKGKDLPMKAEKTARPPNIVWIMADDLSWADLGCYGQEKIETPNIDRMAREGMRFGSCYSGAPLCAPARSSLMQGLHQGHATVRNNFIGFERDGERIRYRHSLQPGDVTVADVLRKAGYATGQFGKWGLAVGDQYGQPNAMGFDQFFGYLNQRKAHNYYPEYLWQNRELIHYPGNAGHEKKSPNTYDDRGRIRPHGVDDPKNARYSFDEYTREMFTFVREHKDEPFFLYFPSTIPHGAFEVPELGRYTDRDWPTVQHKVYAAMVTRLDTAVGTLLELLKQLGIDDNTVVFVTSDNGYSHSKQDIEPSLEAFFQHAGPFRGKKGHLNQGGVRVPMIARWPGHIPADRTSDHVWAFYDFMATAADIAGVDLPPNDGISVLPTLLGNSADQAVHEYLYWESRDEQAARFDQWHAVRLAPDAPVEVYDADNDPAQEHDLAPARPDLAGRAREIFAEAHEPTPYCPGPGESRTSWKARMEADGVTLTNNVNTW